MTLIEYIDKYHNECDDDVDYSKKPLKVINQDIALVRSKWTRYLAKHRYNIHVNKIKLRDYTEKQMEKRMKTKAVNHISTTKIKQAIEVESEFKKIKDTIESEILIVENLEEILKTIDKYGFAISNDIRIYAGENY